MYGKSITKEDTNIHMPTDAELRSRYKQRKYSQMFFEGCRSNPVSPVYSNTPDVMQRRK